MAQHWYNLKGEMRYDANLKIARAEGLLPSVTTIDKVIANEGLEVWKINQAIMSALTIPRYTPNQIDILNNEYTEDSSFHFESDSDYIKRIKADSMASAKKAARFGNVLHKMAERFCSNKSLFFKGVRVDVWECFEPVYKWIDNNIVKDSKFCELVLVGNGYAGKADYDGVTRAGDRILLDYKSTFIKPTDIKKDGNIRKAKIYDSWGRQLASLNKVANADIVMSVIISTNPDFTGVWTYEWSQAELDKAWIEFSGALQIFKSVKGL